MLQSACPCRAAVLRASGPNLYSESLGKFSSCRIVLWVLASRSTEVRCKESALRSRMTLASLAALLMCTTSFSVPEVSAKAESIEAGTQANIAQALIDGLHDLVLGSSLQGGPMPPLPAAPLVAQAGQQQPAPQGQIAGNPYCGKEASDFDVPEWDCIPEPPENCYWVVDGQCYEDAKDAFQDEMKDLYDQACTDYQTARTEKFDRDLAIHNAFTACLDSTVHGSDEWLECYVTRNTDSAASFATWQADQAAIATTVATGTASAEAGFLAAIQDCCSLICVTPPLPPRQRDN